MQDTPSSYWRFICSYIGIGGMVDPPSADENMALDLIRWKQEASVQLDRSYWL